MKEKKQQLIKFYESDLEHIKEHLKERGQVTRTGNVTNQSAFDEALRIANEELQAQEQKVSDLRKQLE